MELEKKNLKIIIIGFGIILIVAILMISKSELKQRKNEKENILETEKVIEEIKEAKSLTASRLYQKIQNGEKIEIIDVRPAESFDSKHIINSTNIPLGTLIGNLEKLNKEASYVLVDEAQSLEVMNLAGPEMKEKGIVNAYYLQGGFEKWMEGFYPTISEGNPNSAVDQAKVKYLNSDQLNELIKKEKNVLIIDVREESAYKAERITGSVNIYFENIEKEINKITPGKTIIVYDDGTIDAFKAAVRLFDLGKLNNFALSDGLPTWKEKGYPTEKN